MKHKAQAAMEFLMTYGWALLVVIIVIAALAFFGLLNPARFLPEKCEIAPGISCVDFNAKQGTTGWGNISLLINNGLGTTINMVSLNISGCTNTTSIGGSLNNWTLNQLIIAEGATQNISIPMCNAMVQNSRFRSDIYLVYNTTVDGNIITHTKKGYLVVQVQ